MKPATWTLLLLAMSLVPLQAEIIRVPADVPSIQAGIDSAARGDTVLIAEGTYFENIYFKRKRITVASHFVLDGDTTHISQTVIDGSQPTSADSGSVVYFLNGEDTTAVLSGLTVTGGTGTITRPVFAPSARAGGSISCINSGPNISHNRIINNAIWYLDWGTYEVDILLDGRTFRDHLLSQGSEIKWSEWHEGHSWGGWRAHLDIALQYFFSPSVVGVDENPGLPTEFRLMQNYPNPFNPGTSITYALKERSDVKLEIFNLLGQRVRTLVDANQSTGTFQVVWDGRDDSGLPLTSGLYVYRLETA